MVKYWSKTFSQSDLDNEKQLLSIDRSCCISCPFRAGVFLIIHSTHAWCAAAMHMRFFFLRLVGNYTFSCQ
jgi:hypothetical protein